MFGRNTNKTNLKIARETNETNMKIMEMQLAANEDLWNKSNVYNDPAAQRQRWVNAGYNPAVLLGNTSEVGPAQSFDPIPAQRAEMKPYEMEYALQAANSLSNATMQAAQINKTKAETEALNIDNAYKEVQINQALRQGESNIRNTEQQTRTGKAQETNLNADTSNLNADTQLRNLEYDFNSDTEVYTHRKAQVHQEALKTQAEVDKQNLDNAYKEIENKLYEKYGEKEYEKKLRKVDAEINQLKELAMYYKKQGYAADATARMLKSQANYYDNLSELVANEDIAQILSNGITAETYSDTVEKSHMEGQRARLQRYFDSVHYLDSLYNALERDNYSAKSAKYLYDEARARARLAAQQSDWYAVQQFEELASTVAGVGNSTTLTAAQRRNLDAKMSQIKNAHESDILMTVDRYDNDGNFKGSTVTRRTSVPRVQSRRNRR